MSQRDPRLPLRAGLVALCGMLLGTVHGGLCHRAEAEYEGPRLSPSLLRELSEQAEKAPGRQLVDSGLPRWPTDAVRFSRHHPIDAAYDYGTSALYCPGYLPGLYPGKNLDELCGEQMFDSPWLVQRRRYNPFVIAREQLDLLVGDARQRRERLAWGALYAYIHRGCDEWAADTALAMLNTESTLRQEVLVDLGAPWVGAHLPGALTTISPPEGQVAVDVRVQSNVSYDSVASIERILRKSAERGINAICVADRSRIEGYQKAERVARRLKREGKLAHDLLIIPGQVAYSHTGAVLSLFTTSIIPDNLTMDRTVRLIHREGGLAYLVHPGVPGGPERLAKLDFDGYLIQPSMFEMFRMLSIINEPEYAQKTGLTASNSPYSGTVGLPYTLVEAEEVSLKAIKKGLKDHKAYAAGDVYLPWVTLASWPPMANVSRFLNRYFLIHRYAETELSRYLGADSVIVSTSWDREVRSMMGLAHMPNGVSDIINGHSPLLDAPELVRITAEYSFFRIGYDRPSDTAFIQATIAW